MKRIKKSLEFNKMNVTELNPSQLNKIVGGGVDTEGDNTGATTQTGKTLESTGICSLGTGTA